MAEVVVFHHALGLTPGVLDFADDLRAGGHVVHAPDLYDGQVFDDLGRGLAYAEQVGFGEIAERGGAAVQGLPAALGLRRALPGGAARAVAGADQAGRAGGGADRVVRAAG